MYYVWISMTNKIAVVSFPFYHFNIPYNEPNINLRVTLSFIVTFEILRNAIT